MIIHIAGSARIRFTPGSYCATKWGFSVAYENWMVDKSYRGSDGFSMGGVIDFKDVEKLYQEMKVYTRKNKRKPLSEL